MGEVIQMRDFETVEERQHKIERIHEIIMAQTLWLAEVETIEFVSPQDDPA